MQMTQRGLWKRVYGTAAEISQALHTHAYAHVYNKHMHRHTCMHLGVLSCAHAHTHLHAAAAHGQLEGSKPHKAGSDTTHDSSRFKSHVAVVKHVACDFLTSGHHTQCTCCRHLHTPGKGACHCHHHHHEHHCQQQQRRLGQQQQQPYPQCRHRFTGHKLPHARAQHSTPVSAAAVWCATCTLELQLIPLPCGINNLAECYGASVTELACPASKLVTSITLGIGFTVCGGGVWRGGGGGDLAG